MRESCYSVQSAVSADLGLEFDASPCYAAALVLYAAAYSSCFVVAALCLRHRAVMVVACVTAVGFPPSLVFVLKLCLLATIGISDRCVAVAAVAIMLML